MEEIAILEVEELVERLEVSAGLLDGLAEIERSHVAFWREELSECQEAVERAASALLALVRERNEWKQVAELHQTTIIEIGDERDRLEQALGVLLRTADQVPGPGIFSLETAREMARTVLVRESGA